MKSEKAHWISPENETFIAVLIDGRLSNTKRRFLLLSMIDRTCSSSLSWSPMLSPASSISLFFNRLVVHHFHQDRPMYTEFVFPFSTDAFRQGTVHYRKNIERLVEEKIEGEEVNIIKGLIEFHVQQRECGISNWSYPLVDNLPSMICEQPVLASVEQCEHSLCCERILDLPLKRTSS